MSEPRRQHPVAAVSYVTGILKEYLIPFVVIIILGGRASDIETYYMAGAVVFLLLLFIGGIISWLRYSYSIEDGELRVEYGVFVRKRHYVQRDRIQVIDVSSGLIQRMFGLVSVKVQTAGQSTSDAVISAVTRDEAARIQELLKTEDSEPEVRQTVTEFRLKNGDLLIAASTAGSFGIALSIIGTITAQLNQVISDTQIYEYIEGLDMPGTNLVIGIILVMIIIAWLLSLLGTIIKYSGFTLTRTDNELIIVKGLFERKQLTLSHQRIQAVRIVEGILRQPFGYATVYVDSAGYGEESGTSTVLFPLIKKDRLDEFMDKVIPGFKAEAGSVSPPPRALRRYLIKAVVPAFAVIIPVSMLFAYGYISLILLLPAIWLGRQRHRDAAAGFRGDMLILRYRNLARITAITHKDRIQAADISSIYFQRRRNLINFIITVASGKTGAAFSVSELDTVHGQTLFSWAGRGETKMPEEEKNKLLPGW